MLNATFNNISVTSLSSALLVAKIGVPGENHRPVTSHSQTVSHSVVLSTHRHEWGSNILLDKLHFKYLPFLFRNIHPLLVRNLHWICTLRGEWELYSFDLCLMSWYLTVEKYSIPIWLKIAILLWKRTAIRLKQLQFLFYLWCSLMCTHHKIPLLTIIEKVR
jgi:hypothetical protein